MVKIKTAVNTNPTHHRMVRLLVSFLMATLIVTVYGPGVMAAGLETISPKEANALIQNEKDSPDFVILDIRTPREFNTGHLEGAALIDFYSNDFLKKMQALDKNKTYLIYCRSANRSTKAFSLVKDMGFKSLYNLNQGIIGWEQHGYAIIK